MKKDFGIVFPFPKGGSWTRWDRQEQCKPLFPRDFPAFSRHMHKTALNAIEFLPVAPS